jgi:hypothetical protein
LQNPGRPSTSKHSKTREIIDSEHPSTLIASYNRHFSKYSERRVKVTQVVPSSVWKSVYKDYLEVYPLSSFKENNLKDRVRHTLTELDTGTSNEKRSSTAVLQSEEVLKRLPLTESHAA